MSKLDERVLKNQLELAYAEARNLKIENAELRSLLHKDQRLTAACHAMQGILSNYGYGRDGDQDVEDVAQMAVSQADALLKALEQ